MFKQNKFIHSLSSRDDKEYGLMSNNSIEKQYFFTFFILFFIILSLYGSYHEIRLLL